MGNNNVSLKNFLEDPSEINMDTILKQIDINKNKIIEKSELIKYRDKHQKDSEEKLKGITKFNKELNYVIQKMEQNVIEKYNFEDFRSIFYKKNITLLGFLK
jgi:hypothetical protein